MNAVIVGLYGVYFLAVGITGNGRLLSQYLSDDAKGYAPWILGIIVLAVLSNYEYTADLVTPLMLLFLMSFFLRNFPKIQAQWALITRS